MHILLSERLIVAIQWTRSAWRESPTGRNHVGINMNLCLECAGHASKVIRMASGTAPYFGRKPDIQSTIIRERIYSMANLTTVLKEEIVRTARKEIRQQTAEAVKAAAEHRREVAALKRQLQDLERTISALRGQEASKPAKPKAKKTSKKKAGKKVGKKKAQAQKATRPVAATSAPRKPRLRFSGKALLAHRKRLGLSADNYGKLIGVSGLSIYNWEKEEARPREGSVAALMQIRGIGKREAGKRLEALGSQSPKNEKG